MKRAPFCASEMVLLIKNFVSARFAAGEPVSEVYDNRSPPTVIWTQCGSVCRSGYKSVAY